MSLKSIKLPRIFCLIKKLVKAYKQRGMISIQQLYLSHLGKTYFQKVTTNYQ